MIISLGVDDVPYEQIQSQPKPRKDGKPNIPRKTTQRTVTTGEVAQILEDNYHIIETFVEKHQDDIVESVVYAIEKTIQTEQDIGTISPEIKYSVDDIEIMLKEFITNKEMDGMPGVPTGAALEGRKTALHQTHGPERPSFYDTETYYNNLRAWINE